MVNIATVSTLLGIVGAGIGGYVFLDDRHVHTAEYEQNQKAFTEFLRQSEARGLRRELRQLENTEDERELTPREKAYQRELEDQIEELR
ncbi:MAG: hypothetical protein PVI97_00205 [Candidatus Thiodiazotropha sp.]